MAYWRNTPSHGWLVLSPTELAKVPEFARRPDYEEDVEYTIAFLALPELFDNPKVAQNVTLEAVRSTCRNWYPDIFEKLTGEIATPENSRKRADEKFGKDNEKNYVVICAVGDHSHPHKGYVLCTATLGGIHQTPYSKNFLVKNDRYENGTRFPYVIKKDDIPA